jgi:secreted PhoX family phosphatase
MAHSSESELSGVCFSPDGKIMFVNIQYPGMTLAITGDWPSA